ncbi:hypothetical protein THAOC_29262 [Thalassiosira oceanica]|uniref:Uncharacterized protein n=1 Tax=Thalassiosira oceanica TaxID=159749 RepID=K0REB3_THAOC|nr:hypothetical protein THAOC_29262 [Thalassiosira oceanica]|eukprot:EJK51555.1 hypothetical protein THAOC_29262 [Thalassiosira oceanica]
MGARGFFHGFSRFTARVNAVTLTPAGRTTELSVHMWIAKHQLFHPAKHAMHKELFHSPDYHLSVHGCRLAARWSQEVFDRTCAHHLCHSVLLGRLIQVVTDALASVGLPLPPSLKALYFRQQVTCEYPVFSLERATLARWESRVAAEDGVLFFEIFTAYHLTAGLPQPPAFRVAPGADGINGGHAEDAVDGRDGKPRVTANEDHEALGGEYPVPAVVGVIAVCGIFSAGGAMANGPAQEVLAAGEGGVAGGCVGAHVRRRSRPLLRLRVCDSVVSTNAVKDLDPRSISRPQGRPWFCVSTRVDSG